MKKRVLLNPAMRIDVQSTESKTEGHVDISITFRVGEMGTGLIASFPKEMEITNEVIISLCNGFFDQMMADMVTKTNKYNLGEDGDNVINDEFIERSKEAFFQQDRSKVNLITDIRDHKVQ